MALETKFDVIAALKPYVVLLDSYVSGNIPDVDLEERYRALYFSDRYHWSKDVFGILDGVFAVAEAYVDEPELRSEVLGAVGPEELRSYVTIALGKIRALADSASSA